MYHQQSLLELFQRDLSVWVGDSMGVHLYTNGAWTDSGKIYRNSLNLFDEIYPDITTTVQFLPLNVGDGSFTLSSNAPRYQGGAILFFLAGNVSSGLSTDTNGVYDGVERTVTSIDGYVTIAYLIRGSVTPTDYETMLNVGNIALPYEPYNVVDWYANNGHGYSSGAWN